MRRPRAFREAGRALTLGLATLLVTAIPVHGQDVPDGRDRDRARLEERIRARMGEIIRERLGLTEAEEQALSGVVQEYERRRRALLGEERAAREEVEALVKGSGEDPARAEELLQRIVTLRQREAELFREEQERLLQILTPSQVLELHHLRMEIGRRIRSLRGGREGGADRPRGQRSPGEGTGAEGAPAGPGRPGV